MQTYAARNYEWVPSPIIHLAQEANVPNKQIYCPSCHSPNILRETRVTKTEAHNNEGPWEWVTLYDSLFDTLYTFICQRCHHLWYEGDSLLINKPK